MASNITSEQFLNAAKYRRTVYGLKGTSKVSDQRVEEIVREVMLFGPSSYNTQPVRATILFGDKHKQFWDVVLKEAEPVLKGFGEQVWNTLQPMFQGHKGAYGSVVFWESEKTIKESGEKHQASAHMFPAWSEAANGMHQIMVWSAIELEGVGANLQHVNAIPNVEDALRKFCGVPEDWKLKAQLVYGDEPADHPQRPDKIDLSETLTVLK